MAGVMLATLVTACVAGPLHSYVPPGEGFEIGRGSVRLYSTMSRRLPQHTERLAELLELDVAAVQERLGTPLPAPVDVVISDDFEVEPGEFTHELGRHVDGFYNRGRNIVFVEFRSDLAGLRATLRHELAHAAVGSRFPNLPQWLSEGIATTCEDLDDAPLQWARLLKFAARLRDRGPVELEEVVDAPVESYSDYNDAWAAFFVLERWLDTTPMEVLRLWQAGEVDQDRAARQFMAFQRRLRGRDGFRLEDVLSAVKPLEELDAEDAAQILAVLGQSRAQPVLAIADFNSVLELHRRAVTDPMVTIDPRWTERVLGQAVQPFLEPLIVDELGRMPDLRDPESVREALARLTAAEDVYFELVDRLLPGCRSLDVDLRPLALRARHEALGTWVLRNRDVVAEWMEESVDVVLPQAWRHGARVR